jgi:diaminohydroxyphosphoribosylaminopyrimidine deaminase / 5-amino-6-(5-phosphoribosylamino)uracil reductase
MFHERSVPATARVGGDHDEAWALLRALAAHAPEVEALGVAASYAFDGERVHAAAPGAAESGVRWVPGSGWQSLLPADAPQAAFIDLYLPLCAATAARPLTVGHLGQSLDGFIATHSGDSQFVTGEENLRHMHRMRALSDAVIVGAGTVAADDPQLTTRQVSGTSPLRVVIDPMRRLAPTYRVFQDEAAPTLYVCGRGRLGRGEHFVGAADVLGVREGPGGLDLAELVDHLRGRGCARLFVEGGGVTVSAFLAAGLLDRLHVAVAPFLIGAGRPAIRLPAPDLLRECARPRHRVFRMGSDMLFDCDMRAADDSGGARDEATAVTRVI